MEEVKKKQIVFLINTYFQIIVATVLKLTKYKNDNVDIIVSNHSTDATKIYDNLKKCKVFNNIFYFESKENKTNKLHKAIDNMSFILFAKKELDKRIKLDYYDEFWFYNINKYTYLIYDVLCKKNNNLKVFRFEEGYISYLLLNIGVSNSYIKLRKFFNKNILEKNIDTNYFFNPDCVIYNLENKESIDKISSKFNDIKLILNEIFEYTENDKYDKKYIFFEESFFCDENRQVDDLELVLKIADIVGKENLLVKLHPRNKINRFEQYGIATNKTIGIPWEVIQMNNDFSNNVFLTISSGSVLASRLYFNDNIKTYMLFNCTEKKSDMVTKEYLEYLTKLNDKFGLDEFIIPKNCNEFLENLVKENKKE